MVHGILQFTPSIAFRYVLHRCESRDIRCRESFRHIEDDETARTSTVSGDGGGDALSFKFLGAIHAGVQYAREGRSSGGTEVRRAGRSPPEMRGRGAARPSAPKR